MRRRAVGDRPRTGRRAGVVGLDQSRGQLRHARANIAAARRAYRSCARAANRSPFGTRRSTSCSATTVPCRSATPTGSCPESRASSGRGAASSSTTRRCCTTSATTPKPTARGDRLLRRTTERTSSTGARAPFDFHRTYGGWIRLFRDHGLVVDDLIELVPPPDASTTYPDFVPVEWAARWPAEEIWVTRKLDATERADDAPSGAHR